MDTVKLSKEEIVKLAGVKKAKAMFPDMFKETEQMHPITDDDVYMLVTVARGEMSRFRPGTVFDAEAPVPINGRGYRGPEPADPRPPGLLRIAVLGDSVAFGSAAAWPEILAERLGRSFPGREVEVLNFGVPGYTVVQGLRQFEEEGAVLEPDLVLVAYGWNDHWIARGGLPDADRDPRALEENRLALALARLRLTQALQALLALAPEGGSASDSSTRRVPPPAFEEHVGRLLKAARSAGAVPVVIDLPRRSPRRPFLLVGFSVLLSLALNHVLRKYVPIAANLQETDPSLFWVRTIILLVLVYFGYQTVISIQHLASRARSEKLQDTLFGAFLGALNGYLVAGSVLYYIHIAGYPFKNVVTPPVDPILIERVNRMMLYMPPQLLGEPGIYFAIILAFVFVLVVYI